MIDQFVAERSLCAPPDETALGCAGAAGATLALAIGANAAFFSLANAPGARLTLLWRCVRQMSSSRLPSASGAC